MSLFSSLSLGQESSESMLLIVDITIKVLILSLQLKRSQVPRTKILLRRIQTLITEVLQRRAMMLMFWMKKWLKRFMQVPLVYVSFLYIDKLANIASDDFIAMVLQMEHFIFHYLFSWFFILSTRTLEGSVNYFDL